MMEILVAIVIITLIRIFVNLYIRVSAMLFYDSPIPLIIAIFSLFCLFPIGRHKLYIERERKYRWADIRSEINPLYVAGFFRKSASDKNILSNLKGKFYCEIALCGIWVAAFICKMYTVYECRCLENM